LKGARSLRKVVYASAGCAAAAKTFEEANATTEDMPISLYHDSPYSISKLIGEMYGNYYFARYGLPFVKARFQNVYGPGEILGARVGPFRAALRRHAEGARPPALRRGHAAGRGFRAHHRLDPREPGDDPATRAAARRLPARVANGLSVKGMRLLTVVGARPQF